MFGGAGLGLSKTIRAGTSAVIGPDVAIKRSKLWAMKSSEISSSGASVRGNACVIGKAFAGSTTSRHPYRANFRVSKCFSKAINRVVGLPASALTKEGTLLRAFTLSCDRTSTTGKRTRAATPKIRGAETMLHRLCIEAFLRFQSGQIETIQVSHRFHRPCGNRGASS